mmetsp:Transcript_44848/g.74283  ORF Transcript_44848/g.74283 Transcript_44848/m.74283 type:complete len:227 (+) Transcript_44848:1218-1898(+)
MTLGSHIQRVDINHRINRLTAKTLREMRVVVFILQIIVLCWRVFLFLGVLIVRILLSKRTNAAFTIGQHQGKRAMLFASHTIDVFKIAGDFLQFRLESDADIKQFRLGQTQSIQLEQFTVKRTLVLGQQLIVHSFMATQREFHERNRDKFREIHQFLVSQIGRNPLTFELHQDITCAFFQQHVTAEIGNHRNDERGSQSEHRAGNNQMREHGKELFMRQRGRNADI